jgi:hypothetical protein
MRTVLTHAAAAVLLAGLLAAPVRAADVRPAAAPAGPEVHQMVILNGPAHTVHYFSVGLSTYDQAALRDLERAENDASYAADLLALRRRYVADELYLEPRRAAIQAALYGQGITRTGSNFAATNAFGLGGYGYGGYPYYTYPGYYVSYPGVASGYVAGPSSTISQSLAYGVGDEGAIKTAMAPVIAAEAGPEYATTATRAYTNAVNRAAESEALRTALNYNPKGPAPAANATQRVTLTLKDGGKVEGTVSDEDADWITVDNGTDQVSVRKADVTRMERHKAGK